MVLDLIIIAIIAIRIIRGYKKGLIEVAFRIVSFIVAIALSLMLYGPVSNYIIDNTEIDDGIRQTIIKNMNPEELENQENEEDGEEEKEEGDIPAIISDYIENTVKEVADNAKTSATEVVAKNISIIAVKIIALVGIFIAIRLLLTILKIVTNIIAKLPVISSANKIRRNCLWNIRGIINNLYSPCSINGYIYDNSKYRNIKVCK